MRLFTYKGVEIFSYDSFPDFLYSTLQKQPVISSDVNQVRTIHLFYSFGDEDFDYAVRLSTLKQQKELGKGNFGVVNLMYDDII